MVSNNFTSQSDENAPYEDGVLDDSDSQANFSIDSFDLVSSPNDFNTKTIVDFIESGVVAIPNFQRAYVWDIKRASRLIESIIVGLPIPQIFLYEQAKNEFRVIDGQQRLMSIYYFVKERFPKKEKLHELKMLLETQNNIQEMPLSDNNYFTDFQLNLPELTPGRENQFHRLKYSDLDVKYRSTFDMRTIRNIIVQQIQPNNNNSMYEIFHRLNSGGVNLRSQEIRRCLYDSKFYDLLYHTNTKPEWRQIVGAKIPDIHMRDVEVLLRGFAMLVDGKSYRPSLVKFLNQFSQNAKNFNDSRLAHLQQLLDSFLENSKNLPNDAFHNVAGRLSPMIFESVFVAICAKAYSEGHTKIEIIDLKLLNKLKSHPEFKEATKSKTSDTTNMKTRLDLAHKILVGKDG